MSDKNSILERLSRRDAQRIEKLQKAHKAREEVDATDENEDFFSGSFKIKSEHIEDLLTQVPTLETIMLPAYFDIIKKELNELQKQVVTSSFFLKEFNMRKYLGIVQNLQTLSYELEDKYIPRKKFGFSKSKLSVSHTSHTRPSLDDHDAATQPAANKYDENLFGFDSLQDQTLSLKTEELFQRDVTLRNLKGCTVLLKGVMGTLHMTNLENCLVLTGPVNSSVFMDKCINCKIVTACQQLRMHTSTSCDIYLHVTSKGIIEDCTKIQTAPYNFEYEDLDKHFKTSSLDRTTNHWDSLDDFNWLAPDVPSPNWSIMNETNRIRSWDEFVKV